MHYEQFSQLLLLLYKTVCSSFDRINHLQALYVVLPCPMRHSFMEIFKRKRFCLLSNLVSFALPQEKGNELLNSQNYRKICLLMLSLLRSLCKTNNYSMCIGLPCRLQVSTLSYVPSQI